MKNFDLIIFDCDGVLVDSESISQSVIATYLTELGFPYTVKESETDFKGRAMTDVMRVAEERYGKKVPEEFLEEYERRLIIDMKKNLKAVPGAKEILEQLDLPFCVASSGSHEKMKISLGITDIWPLVEGRIFSADDVGKGKPNPDLFLHTAKEMGVDPQACLVIEDSVNGVLAAKAAGMTAWGFSRETPQAELKQAGADWVFGDFRELDFNSFDPCPPL